MRKFKKLFRKTLLVFGILIPVASFAHFILFPQQTRSILVDFSDFKKNGRLYFNPSTPKNTIDTVQFLINMASCRVRNFWGGQTCNPKFIHCYSDEDFKRFGSPFPVPAVTHIKFCSYIVISNQGIDLDIISHELSHSEFYERIGFYNWTTKIPRWFDEGLAMQNDFRNYYSEDTLRVKTKNLRNLPDIKKLTSSLFDQGDIDKVMLNYMAAKHEIKTWYTKEKLEKFINDINSGKSFEEAYGY